VEGDRVNDWWSLDPPNRMNLRAAAAAARGLPMADAALFSGWLDEESIDIGAETAALTAAFLGDTWTIMRKALYINDFVFNDSSRFPLTVERAWWSMRSKHSLGEWFPERRADMELDASRLNAYLEEKREALATLDTWIAKLETIEPSEKSKIPFLAKLGDFRDYILGWQVVGSLCLLAEAVKGQAMADERPALKTRLAAAVGEARAYAARIRVEQDRRSDRHQYAMLADPARVDRLIDECKLLL